MTRPRNIPLLFDQPLVSYLQARLVNSTNDYYRGRRLSKLPEDLRTYQHLIEESQPEVIIEFGTHDGGSAIWFADQLANLCGGGKVITVDWTPVVVDDPRVTALTGGVTDTTIVAAVHAFAANRRVFISEDSAHTYATTLGVLESYASLIASGSWFVVEDGVVDDRRLDVWDSEGGVTQAIGDFLKSPTGERFASYDLRPYGLTSNPHGWLQAR